MRTVICHYHIFKNSGASFDRLLRRNFKNKHCAFDGPFRFLKFNQDELAKIIQSTNNVSYSSHQINLPIPTSLDFLVEPVIFIRHPLLRIRSIYRFARKSPNAVIAGHLASKMSFSDWIKKGEKDKAHLAVLSNSQTRFVSATYCRASIQRKRNTNVFEFDLNQAFRNLDHVKLLGRTEFFDVDVPRFEKPLQDAGINFSYKKLKPSNTTASDLSQSLSERLAAVSSELGDSLYSELMDRNHQDIKLFEYACLRLE